MHSAGWTVMRIRDVGRVVTGRTPPTERSDYFGTEYPFVTPSDMDGTKTIRSTERGLSQCGADLLKSNRVQPGSIAVSCIGWQMGKVAMLSQVSYTNQQINTIIPNSMADVDFLYYSLCTRRSELKNLGSVGTRTPILNKSRFEDLSLPLPPLPVQRTIAGILSAYDDLIETNTRRIAILEEMAQALYREWFVNFRFPGRERCRMVESALGTIPEGWRVAKLGDVARLCRGRSYSGSELVDDGGMPFLNLKCIERGGGFRYDGIKRYVGPHKESQLARPGDIIMAVTDMTQERRIVARAARVPTTGEPESVISMDLVRIAPESDIPRDYLYSMLRWSSFADEVKQHANGVNVLHLHPDRIGDFRFSLPPTELGCKYAGITSDMFDTMDVLRLQNANLRLTRDILLPTLVSGEVNVEQLDIETETEGVIA